MMVLEREAFEAAAERLDLVLAPGVLAIVAPGPAHLAPDILAERRPIVRRERLALRRRREQQGKASGQHRAAGEAGAEHSRRLAVRAPLRYVPAATCSVRIIVRVNDRPADDPQTDLWFRPLPRRAGSGDRPRPRRTAYARRHAHGCGQVALLPAASADPRRHGARHIAAHRADARSDPKRQCARNPRGFANFGR